MKKPVDPKKNTKKPPAKKDAKDKLKSVGVDSTSYKGNQASRVISIPNWDPSE